MKRYIVFSLLLFTTLGYAAAAPETTTQAAASQVAGNQLQSNASLEQLKQNIADIKEQASVLVPKIKAAFEQNGVQVSWFKRLAALGSDQTIVNSLKELVRLVTETTRQAISLLRSPDLNVQAQVKSLVASLAGAPQVQQLATKAKEIPIVGGLFSTQLQNLTGKAQTTNAEPIPVEAAE